MNKKVISAMSRGRADYGWLKANYSFSFANYYNPENIHFGTLRVLNEDYIAPSMGFGTHPHDNMEIVTIPISGGGLLHRDSEGHEGVIKPGDVQVMSAGTGIEHSEENASKDLTTNLMQIWVFPRRRGYEPRYDQKAFDVKENPNKLHLVVSPEGRDGSLWVNQDAFFSLGAFTEDKSLEYKVQHSGNGLYIFVVDGPIEVEGERLSNRDAISISEADSVTINASAGSYFLIMDIPMHINAN